MCALGVLGDWLCVRGPPGSVDNAHSGLEVAALFFQFTDGSVSMLLPCKYFGNSNKKQLIFRFLTELSVMHSGFLKVLAFIS